MESISVFEVLLVSSVLLTNVFLIWASLTRAKNKTIGISFSVFIFTVIIWVGSAFLSEVLTGISEKLTLTKLAYAGVIMAFPALIKFLGFLQSDKKIKLRWMTTLVVIPSLGLAVYTLLSDGIIESISVLNTSFDINFGNYYLVFAVYALLYGALIAYLLIRGYLRSSGDQRRAYRLVVIGIAIFTAINIFVNILVPAISGNQDYYRYGNYSVIFFTSLTTYSIIAHNLFEIRTFTTATVAIGINILLISKLFLSESLPSFLVNLLLSLIVGIGSILLVRSISREISRRHEVEKLAKERIKALTELEQRNKNLATLQKISRLVLDEIELKPMAQKILDEIPRQLENCRGALLSLVNGRQLGAYAISSTDISEKIFRLVGADISKYSYPLKSGFNLLHDTLLTKQTKESDHLSDFISPPISKALALTLQKIIGAHYTVAVPLYAGVEPLGVMMFTFKVGKEELSQTNMDMIHAIADDMSIAIQRAEAYQKLKDANEYLAELDKLKDEFISMASHELNTPLAAVEGYLSMTMNPKMDAKINDKAREYLQRAFDSSRRLAALIMDLLNVSRIEQGRLKMKFVKTNLYDLADSVVKELQIKADAKKLSLDLRADKNKVLETFCDSDRIREVFVNLVGNAIKYTEKGGIVIKLYGDAHKVVAEVTDTGRGIAPADQKKLFQKFSQVKREQDQQHGTGLGLYISKNFVELHKGRIWVESEEGKGSTFYFELPVLKEAPKAVEGVILENSNASAPDTNKPQANSKKQPNVVTGKTLP